MRRTQHDLTWWKLAMLALISRGGQFIKSPQQMLSGGAFVLAYNLSGKYVLVPASAYLISQLGFWGGLLILNAIGYACAGATCYLVCSRSFSAKEQVEVQRWYESAPSPIKKSLRLFVMAKDWISGIWFGPVLVPFVYHWAGMSKPKLVRMTVLTTGIHCSLWFVIYGLSFAALLNGGKTLLGLIW